MNGLRDRLELAGYCSFARSLLLLDGLPSTQPALDGRCLLSSVFESMLAGSSCFS